MPYLELQIITTVVFLIGESLLIFKKKSGWAWRQIGLALLVVINYLMHLWWLIVPTVGSMIVGLIAYLKWRKDDKKKITLQIMNTEINKNQRKYSSKILKDMALFAKATKLCVTHGLILATPAKEVKRMKLRQIETELKTLKEKK